MNVSFTIVTPTYNRAQLLHKTAATVLAQNFIDFEWIIVDDGSTDNTSEIVAELNDPRIRYIKIENSERAAARNVGIKNAKGRYITFLDSDDVYYKDYLQNAFDIISKQSLPFFHLAYERIDPQGKVIYPYEKFEAMELFKGNFLSCLGVFIRKDITEDLLFVEDRNLAGSEDYEYWLRIYGRHGLTVFDKVSAGMVFHSQRGEMNITNPEKFTRRFILLISLIEQDRLACPAFTSSQYRKMFSILYIYLAITLAKLNTKKEALKYFIKSIKTDPFVIVSRYFFSFVYNFVMNVRSN